MKILLGFNSTLHVNIFLVAAPKKWMESHTDLNNTYKSLKLAVHNNLWSFIYPAITFKNIYARRILCAIDVDVLKGKAKLSGDFNAC